MWWRNEEAKMKRMRKMFEWNKCKVNEPHAKLKHRRFNDYDVKALKRASRSFVMVLCVN
jgi:uncharacterized protein (DUF2461 family)